MKREDYVAQRQPGIEVRSETTAVLLDSVNSVCDGTQPGSRAASPFSPVR